jgi:hypothetical protein
MDDIKSCPYNPTHKFKQYKLLAHINRCKDKYKFKPGDILTCKADNTNKFHINSKLEHENNCHACGNNNLSLLSSSQLTKFSDKTATKVELELTSSINFNPSEFLASDDFYTKSKKDLEKAMLNNKKNESTIIY